MRTKEELITIIMEDYGVPRKEAEILTESLIKKIESQVNKQTEGLI